MTMTLYNKARFAYEYPRTPRRDRGAGRHGVPGRCSHEEDDRALGEAFLTRARRAPTL